MQRTTNCQKPTPMRLRRRSAETVFEYMIEPKTRTWVPWETRLSANYKPPPELPFFKILVRAGLWIFRFFSSSSSPARLSGRPCQW